MVKTISTPYGEFELVRKDVAAISVVRPKWVVRHHRKRVGTDEVTHIEHRHIPNSPWQLVAAWAQRIATYDLNGNEIPL